MLRNRNEKIEINGDEYELCIYWGDSWKRSAFGMPPATSYIRKNGKNFAYIDCETSHTEDFWVKSFHSQKIKVRWLSNVNTFNFRKLITYMTKILQK